MVLDLASGFNFFMPIFSYLLVFIIVYALLAKTNFLGANTGINIFISLIVAAFFIVNVSLIDYVKFSTAWVAVFIILIFFIALIVSGFTGKWDKMMEPWVGWVIVAALVIFFVISSSVVFNWAINLDKVSAWMSSEWFGFVLVLIIAGIVSWVLTKK